ncbi:MAG: anti-sigma factor family protein [Acidimicrobiales bacterium]
MPPGEHPGDALSALLDGELDAAGANQLRAHLQRCPACTEELQVVRSVRRALRTLPGAEPPSGFLDAIVAAVAAADDGGAALAAPVVPLVRRRHRHPGRAARAAASVAASVAVVVAVGAIGPQAYGPRVDAAVGRHVESLSAMSAVGLVDADGGADPLRAPQPVTPTTAPRRDPERLPPPFEVPSRLAEGYRLVDAFYHPQGLQLVYQRGRYGLSVFEARGRLDFSALPAGGRRIDVAGADGWRWETEGVDGRVVVFEREGMVLTVVGDEPGKVVADVARSLPGPRPLSPLQRLNEVAVGALEALSP